VNLVGFITKKFVTLHGHMNVKNDCICRCLFDIAILVHGYEQDKV